MEIDYKLELKNFLDDKDRLTKYPSKHRLKIYTLFYLAQQFEDNKEYTEKEVNELINNFHTFMDPSLLRRELFERKFLDRKKDGSLYWKREIQPNILDFKI